jgi:hypothetical protein
MPLQNPSSEEIIAALQGLVADGIEAGAFVIIEADPARRNRVCIGR